MNTTPKHKLGIAMQHMIEQGKRPCFRIDGLRITIASEISVNPGSLYIKDNNWGYIGKISPDGFIKIMHPSKITGEQKMLVMAAIHDPEHTAMTNGKVTGRCCCCGRQLTNPLSIELGIGPICRGFWFPDSPYQPVDTIAMLETLDTLNPTLDGTDPNWEEPYTKPQHKELTSSLKLDLGSPYNTPPTTVDSLVLGFRELSPDQRVSFINIVILEAVNPNGHN